MKVLVACEYSGIVRDAFIAKGHDAISCDLLPSEVGGPHYQGDVTNILHNEWDLIIAHPPCTHLTVSGARWFPEKIRDGRQKSAIDFFLLFTKLNCAKVVIENPIGIMSSVYRKPDQYINPWEYGHGETKKTCLWLKGVPKLKPTNIVEGRDNRIHRLWGRGHERSKTYEGWAIAMADQWG